MVVQRSYTVYTHDVIVSFRHKGLQLLYEQDDARLVRPDHATRLKLILGVLDQAVGPEDLTQLHTLRAHQLTGDLKGHWSVRVNGNWRVTFRFVGTDVELVDYQDYH